MAPIKAAVKGRKNTIKKSQYPGLISSKLNTYLLRLRSGGRVRCFTTVRCRSHFLDALTLCFPEYFFFLKSHKVTVTFDHLILKCNQLIYDYELLVKTWRHSLKADFRYNDQVCETT